MRTGSRCLTFWWSRSVRTMRAKTAATFGVTWGASSAMNRTGSRWSEPDDGRPSTVPEVRRRLADLPSSAAPPSPPVGHYAHSCSEATSGRSCRRLVRTTSRQAVSDFDALDPLGHDQLIGPRPASRKTSAAASTRERNNWVSISSVVFLMGRVVLPPSCSGLRGVSFGARVRSVGHVRVPAGEPDGSALLRTRPVGLRRIPFCACQATSRKKMDAGGRAPSGG